MKKNIFLYKLLIAASLIAPQQSQASDCPILSLPDPFPGHTSRSIQGTVTIPDYHDFNHYQQDKLRNEAACQFNSLLAGIMLTPYGRQKVQHLIASQDDDHVFIKFYFPNAEELSQYDGYYSSTVKLCNDSIGPTEEEINLINDENDSKRKNLQEDLDATRNTLLSTEKEWQQILKLSNTWIKVPKKFVTKDKGSFPHDNPDWLHILQQAYMKVTKINLLRPYSSGGYEATENFLETDCFAGVPRCSFYKGSYTNSPNSPNSPNWLHIIPMENVSVKSLYLFPLIDIPLKSVTLIMKGQGGLDLEKIQDMQVTRQGDEGFTYTPRTYKTMSDFSHQHGLTKEILMASNVLEFDAAGHAVTLFFGQGKVHYYDNVKYDHPDQIAVYGKIGPIFEEGKFFAGHSIEKMTDEAFFTNLFQEIQYRREQVARVRKKEAYSNTTIYFFERPLVLN